MASAPCGADAFFVVFYAMKEVVFLLIYEGLITAFSCLKSENAVF